MASKTAILTVRILSDSKQAQKDIDETATKFDKFKGGLDKITPAAAVALGGITALAIKAGNAASEAEQAAGAVDSVFGAYAENTKKLAEDAAQRVGLAEQEYNQLASVLGAQLNSLGISQEDLGGQTDELISLGADLAATFGGTTADAVGALSSLMRGERDPIEKFGVAIKQADIEAKKAELGLTGLEGEAARAADTQATLALLTEQTAAAQGQFAREADTAAGAQARANAEWQNAIAQLGEVLLPIMAEAANLAADLAGWVQENSTVVQIFAVIIAGLAAGILLLNGALRAYQIAQTVATAAQWAFNIAASANPIGLIILAVAALIGIIIFLIANWEEVQRVVTDVIDGIIGWINDLIDQLNLRPYIDAIITGFQEAGRFIGEVWDNVIAGIQAVIGWISDAINTVSRFLGLSGDVSVGGLDLADGETPMDDWGTGGWPVWASPVGGSGMSGSAPAVQNITINVEGAIDKEGTAATIRDVLSTTGRRSGELVTAGGTG